MMATITSIPDPTDPTDVAESVENPHTMIINVWESYCAARYDTTLLVPTETCKCWTAECQAGLY